MTDRMPHSLVPTMFKQPFRWWLGDLRHGDLYASLGLPNREISLRKRPALIWRRFKGVRPRPLVRAKEIYTRGRRGYTLSDTWSLDTYIMSWLPEAIDDLREGSHGYPGGCDGMEQWNEILLKIATGLRAGRAIGDMDYYDLDAPREVNQAAEERLHAEFDEAMDLMKKWWFGLWN